MNQMNILITKENIEKKICEIANRLPRENIKFIIILKGGAFFGIDLLKRMNRIDAKNIEFDFIKAESYGNEKYSSGKVDLNHSKLDIKDKDIIILDDIFETGQTIERVIDYLKSFEPSSIKTCVLMMKVGKSIGKYTPDYFGFICPDKFLVGYGMGDGEKYRCLSDISTIDMDR